MNSDERPKTDLIGVYRLTTDWEGIANDPAFRFYIEINPRFVQSLVECNEPSVLVELHVHGALCWGGYDPDAVISNGRSTIFDLHTGVHVKPGLVEFDPFAIRQSHTTDHDTAFQDFSFLNSAGTATHDGMGTPQDFLKASEDFRIVMILRRFADDKPILTPFREFASYTVTDLPERLDGLSLFTIAGAD